MLHINTLFIKVDAFAALEKVRIYTLSKSHLVGIQSINTLLEERGVIHSFSMETEERIFQHLVDGLIDHPTSKDQFLRSYLKDCSDCHN